MTQVRNRKKRVGRPVGSKTRYPGINIFCAELGISHQFVRSVLDGSGSSDRVVSAWQKFQDRRNAG